MTNCSAGITRAQIHQRIQGRYGAAQAALLRRLGSLDLAEDAMQDAVIKALETWPEQGIPQHIVAWLVTTGMNAFRDRYRRDTRGRELIQEHLAPLGSPEDGNGELPDWPAGGHDGEGQDDVLRLIFMCCHPALAVENQIALTLKVVLGFSLQEIASALLVKERTLEQRLTRSKRKIAANAIEFELPHEQHLQDRLGAVQQVLYLIFNEGYYGSSGVLLDQAICRNAILLCRALCRLYPQPENLGLLALMLFLDARAPARLGEEGELVTLDRQDRKLWLASQIQEADVLLQKSLRHRQAGTYQLQAAIAGLHSTAISSAETDWQEIVGLYQLLLRIQDEPVVRLNCAVAMLFAGNKVDAESCLSALQQDLSEYSPYWAARAKLAELNADDDARIKALEKAMELGGSREELRHYAEQLAELQGDPGKARPAMH